MSKSMLNTGSLAVEDRADKRAGKYGLDNIGLINLNRVYWNLSIEALSEEIVSRSEGRQSKAGSIIIDNGDCRHLSINDKFIVRQAATENKIWWGEYNRPFSETAFNALYFRILAFLQKRDLFVQDCYAGSNPEQRFPIRIITEFASHSLFARNMFFQPESPDELSGFVPEFTIIDIPSFEATPHIDGTLSSSFMLHDFDKKLCLIGHSRSYAEIKNSVDAIMNFRLPQQNVLTLRSLVNTGEQGDSALFIGSESSGLTALTNYNNRNLIGESAHGWSDEGIFSLNAGCHTDLKSLSYDKTPLLLSNIDRSGTIFENVDPETDLETGRMSDNARAACPIQYISNQPSGSYALHPKNIFIVTCDAAGVLPPIARLTPEQAIYYFLSGYESKIDGADTETEKEPEAIFNPCFNAPLIINAPYILAKMLHDKIVRYKTHCWMINSGWSGGSFATGKRLDVSYCQEAISRALDGTLEKSQFHTDPVFGFEIPTKCGTIPEEILLPEKSSENTDDYQIRRKQLAMLFIGNFKIFSAAMPDEIIKAGPAISDQTPN